MILSTLVFQDRPNAFRGLVDRAGKGASKKEGRRPDVDAGLTGEFLEKPSLGGNVRGNADCPPFFFVGTVKEFEGVQAAGRRRRIGVVNAALANKPFEHLVLVGVEQAQEMDAVLGDGLKAAEGKQPGRAPGLYQACGFLNPIMVRNADNLDSGFVASCDDRRIVVCFRVEGGWFLVPVQICKGVHLQGTTVEACAVWKFQGGVQAP